MFFTWFYHPLIEAWLERQLARLAQLLPTPTRLRRIRRLIQMLDRNTSVHCASPWRLLREASRK